MADVFQLQYKALIDIETRGQDASMKELQRAVQRSGIDKALVDAMQKSSKGIMHSMAGAIGKGIEAGITKSDLNKLKGAMRDASSELGAAQKEVLQAAVRIQEAQEQGAKAEVDAAVESYQIAVKKQQLLEKDWKDQVRRERKWLDKRLESLRSAEEFQNKGMSERLKIFSGGVKEAFGLAKTGDVKGLAKLFGKGASVVEGVGIKQGMAGGAAAAAGGGGAAAGGGAMASAAGALAAAAGPISAVAASLAVVAGALAMVVKLMVDAHGQAREFNAEILNGAGAADLMYESHVEGAGNLESALTGVRDAATDFVHNVRWGVLAEDQVKILKAANETGLTYKEMNNDLGTLQNGMRGYLGVTEVALRYSRLLGVESEELAKHFGEWTDELGVGLAQVEESFSKVTKMAMESGFGVKRFYSMVQQATSGMSLYNARIEEAAALLRVTSDILGQQEAGEFIKTLTKGFVDEGYQDRIKRVMLTGSKTVQNVMAKDLTDAANHWAESFGGSKMQSRLEKFGFDVSGNIGEQLASKLSGMSEKERRAFITEVAKTDKAAARKLENVAGLASGATGNLSDMTKAMDDLSMVGKLQMQMAQVESFFGKGLSELSAEQLVAAEQITGMSGAQLKQMKTLDKRLLGQFEQMRAGDQELLDEFGLVREDGKLFDKNDEKRQNEIKNSNDLLRFQSDALADIETALTDDERRAEQMVNYTRDLSKVAKAGIQATLEKIFQVMQNLYNWSTGVTEGEAANKREAIAASDARRGELEESLFALNEELAEQRRKAEKLGNTKEGAAASRRAGELSEEAMQIRRQIEKEKIRASEISADRDGFWRKGLRKGPLGQLLMGDRTAEEYTERADTVDIDKRAIRAAGGTRAEEIQAEVDRIREENAGVIGGAGVEEAIKKVEAELVAAAMGDQHALLDEWLPKQAAEAESQTKATKKIEDAVKASDKTRKKDMTTALVDADLQKRFSKALEAGTKFTDAEQRAWMTGQGGSAYESALAKIQQTEGVNDFIYRGNARGGTLTPINKADEFIGAKPGGPVAQAMGGGVGHVTINIHGGDTSKIYETVKRAMRNSGVRG